MTGGAITRHEGGGVRTLEDFEADRGYNVLHPITRHNGAGLSPLLVESVSIVQLDPRDGSPDVYHDFRFANANRGANALSALALGKIAAAAGVKWIPELTRLVARERRPNGHVYLRYEAAGAVRQPNGEWHVELAQKDLDTEDVADELREADRRAVASGRAKFSEDEIEERVRQQILQLRKFALGHAETKAKNRVIRRLLSLRQVYSTAELARPFVIPRLLYRPEAAEQVAMAGRQASADLYGTEALAPAAFVEEAAEVGATETGEDPAAPTSGGTGDGPTAVPASPSDDPPEAATQTSLGDEPPDRLVDEGPFRGARMSEIARDASRQGWLVAIALGQRPASEGLRDLAAQWLDSVRPGWRADA